MSTPRGRLGEAVKQIRIASDEIEDRELVDELREAAEIVDDIRDELDERDEHDDDDPLTEA